MDPGYNPLGDSQRDDQDFVDRFRQGPGAISEEEASSRYEQVAPNLPPDVYQQSAQEVFAHLTPEQRMQLGQAACPECGSTESRRVISNFASITPGASRRRA